MWLILLFLPILLFIYIIYIIIIIIYFPYICDIYIFLPKTTISIEIQRFQRVSAFSITMRDIREVKTQFENSL